MYSEESDIESKSESNNLSGEAAIEPACEYVENGFGSLENYFGLSDILL
jgi:hypothetical protein